VASKLTTESAKDMVKAMIAGQRDPRTLAALARTGMKAKHDELAEALDGMFDDHHGELAQLLLDQIAALDGKITQLTARIEQTVAAIPAAWGINADGTTGPDAPFPGQEVLGVDFLGPGGDKVLHCGVHDLYDGQRMRPEKLEAWRALRERYGNRDESRVDQGTLLAPAA